MAGDGARAGVAFVEALVVLLVALLLAGLVLPRIQGFRDRQTALAASRDFLALASAASAYRRETGDWPPEMGPLEGPGPLRRHLPPDFFFLRERYGISWERWVLPNGLPPGSDSTTVVAVTFHTEGRRLPLEIRRALGDEWPRFTVGDRSTFLLEGFRPSP